MKLLKATFLLFIALLSTAVFAEQTPVISQQDLLALMADKNSGVVVLDVRTPAEFSQGHIQGAINISHDQIEENLTQIAAYKNQTVVVHCRSGRRAVSAENILKAEGFSQLRHLDGDMNGWQAASLPVVN
jgi:rhodanese-related sulfurtransferase